MRIIRPPEFIFLSPIVVVVIVVVSSLPSPRCSLSSSSDIWHPLFLNARFPKSSEQYRIRGRLHFVGNDYDATTTTGTTTPASSETCEYFKKERRQIWGNLSDAAREQFHWDDPGLPFILSSEDVRSTMPPPPPSGGRDVDGRVLPPPDNFLLMLLYPFRVDYLRLTDNYRQVDEWDATGGRGMGTRALHLDEGEDDGVGVSVDNDGDGDGADNGGSMCRWKSMRVNP